jgi:hypothetical protein
MAEVYYYPQKAPEGYPEDVQELAWKAWLRKNPRHAARAAKQLQALQDEPGINEWDIEEADQNGLTAQSAARRFWIDQEDLMELLSVGIVQGDRPGSSYYAAELYNDVDRANEIARRKAFRTIFFRESGRGLEAVAGRPGSAAPMSSDRRNGGRTEGSHKVVSGEKKRGEELFLNEGY